VRLTETVIEFELKEKEPQNYVWSVVNRLTGVTLAVYYTQSSAALKAKEHPEWQTQKTRIDW